MLKKTIDGRWKRRSEVSYSLSDEKLEGPSRCCWIIRLVVLKRLRDGVKLVFSPPNCTSWKQLCGIGVV